MKVRKLIVIALAFLIFLPQLTQACSILYYIDISTGKIYVVNNEDYWYDVEAYIQTEPKTDHTYARLWYGWNDFAQGGVNEKGLFFDAAVTPMQRKIRGYSNPRSNLGDEILAQCATVEEALALLEKEKIALRNSNMMFGDKNGNAVVVEWVNGKRVLNWIKDNKLIATNYLLSKTYAGNYPCRRYESIERRINEMEEKEGNIEMRDIGNTMGEAVQPAASISDGERIGGTVYTSFINITDNEFILSYKLSNENIIKLDLNDEFAKAEKQKIALTD